MLAEHRLKEQFLAITHEKEYSLCERGLEKSLI